jgi:hypothetical protein
MDYDFTIPDIYNQDNTKSDLFDIQTNKYYLKPHEIKSINIEVCTLFLYFETENTNIFFGKNSIIWNKKILFHQSSINVWYYLINNSDNDAIVNIYSVFNETIKKNKNKLIQSFTYNTLCKSIDFAEYNNFIEYNRYVQLLAYYKFCKTINLNDLSKYNSSEFTINLLEHNVNLVTLYCGINILYQHYIKTTIKITDKIIKLNSFNINVYYKIKLLHEKHDSYTYNLILCGIKNTFTDEYKDLDLTYNNIYEIYPKYLQILKDIKIFMNNNLLYIESNNIKLPEDIRDPYGTKNNVFYTTNLKNIIKKYNIYYCESTILSS